jgi:hypothetical protein
VLYNRTIIFNYTKNLASKFFLVLARESERERERERERE